MTGKDLLHGSRIHLRALEPEDEETLFQWENDPSLWAVSHTIAPFSRHAIRAYLEHVHLDIYQTKQLRLVIALNDDEKRAIGLIDLYDFDPYHQRAGVGILIAGQEDRRHGYAREAMELLFEYVFTTLLLNQLYAGITEDNQPSIELFRESGFQQTGVRKSWIRHTDGYRDELFFQLSRSDWSARNA